MDLIKNQSHAVVYSVFHGISLHYQLAHCHIRIYLNITQTKLTNRTGHITSLQRPVNNKLIRGIHADHHPDITLKDIHIFFP